MRVFVISLPDETARRANSARQLEAAGVRFDFFDAIRGDAVGERCPFDACDELEFVLNTGRHVSGAEIGCFASHRALWMLAVSLNDPIVVMEDDFELRENFASALQCTRRVIDWAGFIRLQNDLRARRSVLTNCDDFVVSRYTKPPHGSMCYCISPAVANRFVQLTSTMNAPVDVFIKKFWEHGQPLYALTPYPVVSSPLSSVPTIARPPKQRKPPPIAVRRFLRKTAWCWRRFGFNIQKRLASRELRVTLETGA